jgi:predicted nucleic acid-binding protein
VTYLLDTNAISDLMNSAAELPMRQAIVFNG